MDIESDRDVILLAVLPRYAEAIFRGAKKVEFRKQNVPKHVRYVVVYETRPRCGVIGYFRIGTIHVGSPEELWDRYAAVGCISESDFFRYYEQTDEGKGLEIEEVFQFDRSIESERIDRSLTSAPQSFRYLSPDAWCRVQTMRTTQDARAGADAPFL